MIDTVIFSLIKGLPFSIKKNLIEDYKCPKEAIDNLKISLKGVNNRTGLKILNQINSTSLLEKAKKSFKNVRKVKSKLFLIGMIFTQKISSIVQMHHF